MNTTTDPQVHLLTESELADTFEAPMRRLESEGEPPFDFWPYFEAIPEAQFRGYDCSAGRVTYVWEHPSGRYQHVLVDSQDSDVFMVIVLDVHERQVVGHRLLNLLDQYGLFPAETAARLCDRMGVSPCPPSGLDKAGVALATLNRRPLNGLRHEPDAGTCGWYIWGGEELSQAPDFFAPVHVKHLASHCPAALPYLSLPPGWRFLVDGDYQDVWNDPELLDRAR